MHKSFFELIQKTQNLQYSPFNEDDKQKNQKHPQLFKPILKIPLQFTFLPVEILSKQLTKLNSPYSERIVYLGPRWDNSQMWHKKYCKKRMSYEYFNSEEGYYFNQKRVNRNSSFLYDSMSLNRFYKTEIYYRAFQGMNPTLNLSEQIIFQSRFQSGNLDCAVKVAPNQYDLFLRIDSNTRGNLFWYYFSAQLSTHDIKNEENVQNAKRQSSNNKQRRVKFNICNITKQKILYQKFMRPYILKKSKGLFKQGQNSSWTQQQLIYNFTYQSKKLRYDFIYKKIKPSKFYQLSFQIDLKENEIVYFAYCIPYCYSDLMNDLSYIKQKLKLSQQQTSNQNTVIIRKLCQSSTGIDVPLLIVGQNICQQNEDMISKNNKKIIFVTGRVHPGETNSSIILSTFMKQICLSKSNIYQYLRKKLIFVIIPMLNPDGVIIGNGRSNAIGKDINRQFKSQNYIINPQVSATKQLVDSLLEFTQIQMYLDFHGHSKMKNAFTYGPNYKINQFNYYKARIFPKIFSNLTPIFRYYSCNYSIPLSKKTTARSVMLNDFGLQFFFTIQTSVGYFYDYVNRKHVMFNQFYYSQLAVKVIVAIKQYYEGIEQHLQHYKQKNRGRSREESPEKDHQQFNQTSNIQKMISFNKNIQKSTKINKLIQQIKLESKKQDNNSEASSDSYNSKQQMQLQKSKQLGIMIQQCYKFQCKKHNWQQINIKSIQKSNENSRRRVYRTQKDKKKKNELIYEQQLFVNYQTIQMKNTQNFQKLKAKKTIQQKNIKPEQHQYNEVQLKRSFKTNNKTYYQPLNFNRHSFFQPKNMSLVEKNSEKSELKMFNFSQMVQNPKSLRYQRVQSPRPKFKKQKKAPLFDNDIKQQNQVKRNIFQLQLNEPIQPSIENNRFKSYPSSFYRIKYQTSHKKHRKEKEQSQQKFIQFNIQNKVKQQNIQLQKNKCFKDEIKTNNKTNFFIKVNRIKE